MIAGRPASPRLCPLALLTCALFSLFAPLCFAQVKLDFGGPVAVEPGYTAVDSGTVYSSDRGFGWIDASGLLVHDSGKPDLLRRDFVRGTKPATFRVSGLKPGLYLLTILSADLSAGHATRVKVAGMDSELPVLAQGPAEASTLQLTVNVRQTLDLVFDSPSGDWIVNSITLTSASDAKAPSLARNSFSRDPDDNKSHTLLFSTDAPGKKLSLTHWGLDTALPDPNNVRRGVLYLGKDQVDVIRVSFPVNEPLVNGDLPASKDQHFTSRLEIAKLAGDLPFSMLPDTEGGVNGWYKNGKDIIPERWAQLIEASQRRYGKKMQWIEPFNEADWGWGQGGISNLGEIIDTLKKDPAFAGVTMAGPSTISSDNAADWYFPIADKLDRGSTHALGGSLDTFINFYLNVLAHHQVASQPELHNVAEGIAGAEYGLQSAIWWLTAERTRSEFVKAVQGDRLAYAEDRPRWSAAAIYRAPGGEAAGVPRILRASGTDGDLSLRLR